jgi:hypothetical protein
MILFVVVLGVALWLSILVMVWAGVFLGVQITEAQKWHCEATGGEYMWVESNHLEGKHYQRCEKPEVGNNPKNPH